MKGRVSRGSVINVERNRRIVASSSVRISDVILPVNEQPRDVCKHFIVPRILVIGELFEDVSCVCTRIFMVSVTLESFENAIRIGVAFLCSRGCCRTNDIARFLFIFEGIDLLCTCFFFSGGSKERMTNVFGYCRVLQK